MCGITGIFGDGGLWQGDGPAETLEAMTKVLAHRGPNSDGHWINEKGRVALGHRRLSVLDPSYTGGQPMADQSGRYVIVYNGEVYNAPALKSELDKAHPRDWLGSSDTEILLELIEEHGPEEACRRIDGMFAFAVFDLHERCLWLARDRFGEKPLYYTWHEGQILFASELRAFRRVKGFTANIDRQAALEFFNYNFVPAPRSILQGVKKLPPGTILKIRHRDIETKKLPSAKPYWSAIDAAMIARKKPFKGNGLEAQAEVERLLRMSVRGRMISDVPLGALLSGGIDSSLVVAIMQDVSDKPVKTFTIGMEADGFDEAVHARAVSKALNTDHTELMLSPETLLETLPELAPIHDEPFADSSQIPTYLVSKLAREQVTVALSGDGADELFGGYNRYFFGPRMWKKVNRIPRPLRPLIAKISGNVPTSTLMYLVGHLSQAGGKDLASGRQFEKLRKLVHLVQSKDQTDFHERLLATLYSSDALTEPMKNPLSQRLDTDLPFNEHAMLHDTVHYLPGDILAKTDRASMRRSLELRTPFLNADLFDLAWSLPIEMKMSGTQGKLVLRDILYSKIDRSLVDRPKAGFAVPIGQWLRGPLRNWVNAAMTDEQLARCEVLDPIATRRLWERHKSGKENHEAFLWSVLMFQSWRDTWALE